MKKPIYLQNIDHYKRCEAIDQILYAIQKVMIHSQQLKKKMKEISHKDNELNTTKEKNIYKKVNKLITDKLVNRMESFNKQLLGDKEVVYFPNAREFRYSWKLDKAINDYSR